MKTKIEEQIRDIIFPVYSKYTIHVVVSEDIDTSAANRSNVLRSKHNLKNSLAAHWAVTEKSEAFIFLTPKADVVVITHECYHAIYRMFNYVEAYLESDQEIIAYHLGYLVGKVMKFIKKTRKKTFE